MEECYDEEYVSDELRSAADELCVSALEQDTDFVLVDPPNTACIQGGESYFKNPLVSYFIH